MYDEIESVDVDESLEAGPEEDDATLGDGFVGGA